MKAKEIKFTGANGVSLPGIIWYPLCSPTMVVQITHGMTEHIGRYEQLAEYSWLTERQTIFRLVSYFVSYILEPPIL